MYEIKFYHRQKLRPKVDKNFRAQAFATVSYVSSVRSERFVLHESLDCLVGGKAEVLI